MGGREKEGNEGEGKAGQSNFLKLQNMKIIEIDHTM